MTHRTTPQRPSEGETRVAAVIPAAGRSRRMGLKTRKPFLFLKDLPVLIHTLRVFESCPLIHEVCLVVPKDMDKKHANTLIKQYGLRKVRKVLPGGKTRQDSVYEGLKTLGPDISMVVVHDAVRPFLTRGLLEHSVRACHGRDGVVVAIPLRDTPKYARPDGTVVSTMERDHAFLAQTPQVFPRKILMEAYDRAYTDGVTATDDSALVERMGYDVHLVDGTWDNIKITTPNDLPLAEFILALRKQTTGK